MRYKHHIIKEVRICCEFNLSGCMIAESFIPRKYETIEILIPEIKANGWKMIKGKTCCRNCVKK